MPNYCVLDYETRSEIDLKKCGAWKYAADKSTRILCAAYRLGDKNTLRNNKTQTWSPVFEKAAPAELLSAFNDDNTILVAHNSLFEQFITRHRMGIDIPPKRWLCTASLSAALALPRSLEGVCDALNLPIKKDMDGHKLMLKYSKKRRPSQKNPLEWHSDTEDLKRLIEYCARDVDSTVELLFRLRGLTPTERKIWELDQHINSRGFRVDSAFVHEMIHFIEQESFALNRQTHILTRGEVQTTTQRDKSLKWVNARLDVPLENLRADTVEAELERIENPEVKTFLEIRQQASKSSTAKYEAFSNMLFLDDYRVRDVLMYHAASTGRWGGRGVQVQNFPRGTVDISWEDLSNYDVRDLEVIRFLYGPPMDVFSSLLRQAIVATPEHTLYCADYASIETRVLFWLAGHEAGLDLYRGHKDLYKEMAKLIFHLPLEKIEKWHRHVGKTAILGLGYGMGWKKFHATCQRQKQNISEELAQRTVKTYREVHSPVPALWYATERAAVLAVLNRDQSFKVGRCTWACERDFLMCQLPSGRKLAYHRPSVQYEDTPWGDKAPKLYHFASNPVTRQWERDSTYGGKLVENVTQAVARDLMAEAMLRIAPHYEILITVHDEILAESKKGDLEHFKGLMAETPEWGKGLPIEVEGWTGSRYRK